MNIDVFNKIRAYGIVPVVALDNADKALPLADSLIEGGLPIVEITFRTPAAAKAIEIIASKRPEIIVGAGTVITRENLKVAKDAGASFAVSPGLNPSVVEYSLSVDFPFIPGIATPSEIEIGLSFGLSLLKFFPAAPLGGLKYLASIYAPYRHTGVKFMATGGIKSEDALEYLSSPAIAAIGGSWLAKTSDINAGNWNEIAQKCRAASALKK